MIIDNIKEEAEILSRIVGEDITAVSMHRPSKETLKRSLDGTFDTGNLINSYGKEFFEGFKYISDSRRRWREDVEAIIADGQHNRLHILTHPFWYNEENYTIDQIIKAFIERSPKDRIETLNENITALNEIIDLNFTDKTWEVK